MPNLPRLLLTVPLAAFLAVQAEQVHAKTDAQASARTWVEERILASDLLQKLDFSSAPQLEAEGDGWRLLLPPATAKADAEAGKLLLRSSDSELLVEPIDQSQIKLQWQLPEVLDLLPERPADEALGALRIGRQRNGGTYDLGLDAFLDIDVLLEELTVTLPAIEASLAEIALWGESNQGDDDRLQSDSALSFQNLTLGSPFLSLDVQSMELVTVMEGIEASGYAELLDALLTDGTCGLSFADPGLAAGAASLRVAEADLALGASSLHLKSAETAFAAEGLEGDESDWVLQLALEDLHVAPLPPLVESFLPYNLELDLAILGLPQAQLDPLFARFEQISRRTGARYATGMALSDLWALLQSSEARINIPSLHWEAAIINVDGRGMMTPSRSSEVGLVGEAYLEISGLPQIIQQLRGHPGAERMVQILTLLQGLGIPVEDTDHGSARRYELLVAPQGQIEVNGTDIMPLVPGLLR